MLAEPKGKRSRNEASGFSDPASPVYQVCSSLWNSRREGTMHDKQLPPPCHMPRSAFMLTDSMPESLFYSIESCFIFFVGPALM